MHEMYLRQTGFIYNACGLFTIIKKEYKNLKKEEIHNIYLSKGTS